MVTITSIVKTAPIVVDTRTAVVNFIVGVAAQAQADPSPNYSPDPE